MPTKQSTLADAYSTDQGNPQKIPADARSNQKKCSKGKHFGLMGCLTCELAANKRFFKKLQDLQSDNSNGHLWTITMWRGTYEWYKNPPDGSQMISEILQYLQEGTSSPYHPYQYWAGYFDVIPRRRFAADQAVFFQPILRLYSAQTTLPGREELVGRFKISDRSVAKIVTGNVTHQFVNDSASLALRFTDPDVNAAYVDLFGQVPNTRRFFSICKRPS